MDWTTLANIATVGALGVTIFLVAQGQHDRRVLREMIAADAARRVSLGVTERMEPTGHSSSTLAGWTLHVRNDGDLPVHVDQLDLVWRDSWERLQALGRRELFSETVELDFNFLVPRAEWNFGRDVNSAANPDGSIGGCPDFVVLNFKDDHDVAWQRRSDTGDLRRRVEPLNRRQDFAQELCRRVPWFGTLVIHPVVRLATKSAHKHGSDHFPRSLRFFRWLWGYWGAGEMDSWMKPPGAPALWGYAELPWTEEDTPGDT